MTSDKTDETNLKRCFEKLIARVHNIIEQLKVPSSKSQANEFHVNSGLGMNVYAFTMDKSEEEQLEMLNEHMKECINDYQTRLSERCKNYLFEFLNQYHYDGKKQMFSSSFTMDSLRPFACSLRGALASIDAFTAAWDGNLQLVKDFIRNYPMFKNKPGLHGTTLLFSAARNNHMAIVEYLVEHGHCTVRAQNLQELEKALDTTTPTKVGHYAANPSAASTALHGACYYGHLDIVQYLIEHGADYFIRNQAGETPISNGLQQTNIRTFFKEFLVLGYSQQLDTLPDAPLARKKQTEPFDCIWEYKCLFEKQWTTFSYDESKELTQSMLIEPGQDIKQSIYLHDDSLLCEVSIDQFLRSTKSKDTAHQLSWVRCRGSSTWNFHLIPSWQIMIIQHSDSMLTSKPTLEAFDIPKMTDLQFKLHLDSWYNCTTRIIAQFETAMNNRRKTLTMKIDFISSDHLTLNFHDFTFTNKDKTISGYIRWRPASVAGVRRSEHVSKGHKQMPNENSRDDVIQENADDDDEILLDENEADIEQPFAIHDCEESDRQKVVSSSLLSSV
jgi:hypothetical protein